MRPTPAWISGVLIVGASLELLAAVRPAVRSSTAQPTVLLLPAPKLEGRSDDWLNTDGQRQSFERGRVYVVEFWTYGCVNCQRNLPAYADWQRQFANQPFTILGVHTPETEAEKDRKKVREQVREWEITYPVLLDPDRVNWNRWQQQIWPAIYLVDKRGCVRYRWLGELGWNGAQGGQIMARCIKRLLAEPLQAEPPREASRRAGPLLAPNGSGSSQ